MVLLRRLLADLSPQDTASRVRLLVTEMPWCCDAEDYGAWTDRSAFEALGDLADEIVVDGSVIVYGDRDDGGFAVKIPFTPETMPDNF